VLRQVLRAAEDVDDVELAFFGFLEGGAMFLVCVGALPPAAPKAFAP
jgi:hypothetical protein